MVVVMQLKDSHSSLSSLNQAIAYGTQMCH